MNALKYQTIVKNGQLNLPTLDLPEGTIVEAILLIQESTEDEINSSPEDSFRTSWKEIKEGKIRPISELWEGIDAE